MTFALRPAPECHWALVSLGEVMLRLDPGDGRIHTTRTFQAWEGGGEYNVARGLRRCFGLPTAIVTALADNPVGRLVEDLMLPGRRRPAQCAGCRTTASGARPATASTSPSAASACAQRVGCSDRGHTAVSQLQARRRRLGRRSSAATARAGSTPAASSARSPRRRRSSRARRWRPRGATARVVSYDLNYRESLWKAIGGQARAREVNRELAPLST